VREMAGAVKASALAVAGSLRTPGLDDAAFHRFAGLVIDRAERCAFTVQP
jgi:hypothetical protein